MNRVYDQHNIVEEELKSQLQDKDNKILNLINAKQILENDCQSSAHKIGELSNDFQRSEAKYQNLESEFDIQKAKSLEELKLKENEFDSAIATKNEEIDNLTRKLDLFTSRLNTECEKYYKVQDHVSEIYKKVKNIDQGLDIDSHLNLDFKDQTNKKFVNSIKYLELSELRKVTIRMSHNELEDVREFVKYSFPDKVKEFCFSVYNEEKLQDIENISKLLVPAFSKVSDKISIEDASLDSKVISQIVRYSK